MGGERVAGAEALFNKFAASYREKMDEYEFGPLDTMAARIAFAEVVTALEAENAALRADAERYRFLRECTEGFMRNSLTGWNLNCDEPRDEWDAAIDAALGMGRAG